VFANGITFCRGQILFKELAIKKSRNECPVLLAVPQSWTKHQLERVVQLFFENFNAPGVYIASQPLMALYGCGAVTGLIIDIGHNTTKVNVAIDSIMQTQSSFTSPVAGKCLTQHLLRYMKQDSILVEQFRAHNESSEDEELKLDEEFAQFVKESNGLCNVLVDHEIEEILLLQWKLLKSKMLSKRSLTDRK
jgi:actin-related protein